MNSNFSKLVDIKNLQEQVKKAFCCQKWIRPFTVWMSCSSDLKNFANSRPSVSNFKSLYRSLEQFFLTVGHNNFGNKIALFKLSVLLNWLKLVYGPCTILTPCPTSSKELYTFLYCDDGTAYNQKAIHYCLWATKMKEEQIVELQKISWCLTPFPSLPTLSCLPLVFLCCWPSNSRVPFPHQFCRFVCWHKNLNALKTFRYKTFPWRLAAGKPFYILTY